MTGNTYHDSLIVDCPRCKAIPGAPCRQPNGRKSKTTHIHRIYEFIRTNPVEQWRLTHSDLLPDINRPWGNAGAKPQHSV